MEGVISRATVAPLAWAILGILFFVPMAIWVGAPQYPHPTDWPAVVVTLAVGCAVGIGFPSRKRVVGVPGLALEIVLWLLIIWAGLFWVALTKIGTEPRLLHLLLLLVLQFLEGFLPVAGLVWVLLLRHLGSQRVLASAVTAAVPFLVMRVVWLNFEAWPGVQTKTLGNFSEFLEYGAVTGLALAGLRVAGREPSIWRLCAVQGAFIAAAVVASLVVWHDTPTLPESSQERHSSIRRLHGIGSCLSLRGSRGASFWDRCACSG
jgi:hypothetical protein